MCGTVGMFVGCTALTFCPKQLLLAGAAGAPPPEAPLPEAPPDELPPDEGYRSPFRTWYERASVRTTPRRMLDSSEIDGKRRYFAPELVPVARHPLIARLPEHVYDEVLVQHLYRYLDFTAKLEYLVVNRTVLGIAHRSVGVPVPEAMRLDAFKMYCDEAYHALFSADLADQVRRTTAITPRLPDRPFFLRRLDEISEDLPASQRPLAELLFVIVSETLISASLAEVPQSTEVFSAVSGAIRDHAVDEGRHHAYFAHFLRRLWDVLDPAGRRTAGALVPRLMDAFLRPDLPALRVELAGYGLARDEVRQVVSEVYAPEVVAAHARSTSQQTRRYFTELGAFDSAEAQEELHRYGLLG